MNGAQSIPNLAESTTTLSGRLMDRLQRLARVLRPQWPAMERSFARRLRQMGLQSDAAAEILKITPAAAARLFARGRAPAAYFDAVERSGQRLARMGVPPAGAVAALRSFDDLLAGELAIRAPSEAEDLRYAAEQLHFCAVIGINDVYLRVFERETQALYRLAEAESSSAGSDELLTAYADALRDAMEAGAARLWIFDAPADLRLAQPVRVANGGMRALVHPGLHACPCCWSIPLRKDRPHSDRTLRGVLQLGFDRKRDWLPRELLFLTTAAARCLNSLERRRLAGELAERERQVRRLASSLWKVQEEERRRIRRELHDDAAQTILLIRLKLDMAMREAALSPEARATLRETHRLAEGAVAEIRRVLSALSPPALEQFGLAAAVKQLVDRHRHEFSGRVTLRVDCRGPRAHAQTEIIAYRLLQEALNNVVRHSRAKTLRVYLRSTDAQVRLSIADDGVGFDPAAGGKPGSFGLPGMRERVALLGGALQIRSKPGRGTAIIAVLPAAGPPEGVEN